MVLPKMKIGNSRGQTIMGRQYDDQDGRNTPEEFIFEHEEHRGLCSGGEQVSGAQRCSAVGRAGRSSEPASVEAYGYQPGCAARSAVASWGLYRADDGWAHRSEDGRDGQISCRGAIALRSGGNDENDRSHEHRGFSEHGWAGGRRGVEQDHRAACDEGRIHGEQVVFLGHNGAGSSDMSSDGGWSFAKDQRAAYRNRETDQEGYRIENGEVQRESGGACHGDQIVHSRKEREDDRAEEDTWEETTLRGDQAVSGSGERNSRDGERNERTIRGGTGLVSQDARTDKDVDEYWLSSFWKDHQFVVSVRTSDHTGEGGEGGGIRAALVYHIIGGWIHHWASVQEAWKRHGRKDRGRGSTAVQGCAGQDAGDVCLRSRRGRADEPRYFGTCESEEELYLSEGQREDGSGQEHFCGCEARAGPFRGGDSNVKMREVQFQQTAGEVGGGVYHKGSDGDVGSQSKQIAQRFERRCSDSGGSVTEEEINREATGDGDRGKTFGSPENENLHPKNVFLNRHFPDRL